LKAETAREETAMAIESLNHYTIRTTDLERSRAFYEDLLGMRVGERPPFQFPGLWLYSADGTPSLHLVGIDPADNQGLTDYLGNRGGSGADTGAIDHIAFVVTGLAETIARLNRAGVPFTERTVPLLSLHQLFVDDPDGVRIELNFAASEKA
jgi:catechol 2,3-dioxygenase-like lactoylglutathione lyase family enzyme